MGFITNLIGTVLDYFDIGSIKLKNNSGVLELRNGADDAYIKIRANTPEGSNDLVTKDYCDSNAGAEKISNNIYGLNLTWLSASSIRIGTGTCLDSTGDTIIVNNSNLDIDITTHLDTGSEASSTWYYIYVIWNPTTETIAGRFSINASTPTLPEGYTKYRRVGVERNDTSSNLILTYQSGKNNTRKYCYEKEHLILSGGTAQIETSISMSSYVPTCASISYVKVLESGGTIFVTVYLNTGVSYLSIPKSTAVILYFPNITNAIRYKYGSSGGSCYINIFGYEEEL